MATYYYSSGDGHHLQPGTSHLPAQQASGCHSSRQQEPWPSNQKNLVNFVIKFTIPVNFRFSKERSVNPNKSGIGGKPPSFIQNDFTP